METAIIISIISSLTAITVAVLSIIFNSRNQKKTSFELERLKMTIELEKKQTEGKLKQKDETLGGIDLALECSQKIKDNIQLLTNYLQFKSKLTDEWLEKTRQEIHNYSELFSKIFPKLGNAEKASLHDMKKDLHQVDYVIARILYEKKENKLLDTNRLSESLLATRQRLSELQHSLLVRKTIYQNLDEKDSFN